MWRQAGADRQRNISSPAHKRRRRLAIVLAAFAAALGGVVLLAPWAYSTQAMIGEVAAEFRAASGLAFSAAGGGHFTLLPRPRVSIENPHLRDDRNALTIDADRLSGNLGLLALLRGRLEVSGLALARARIFVDLDRGPMGAAGAPARAAATQPSTAEARRTDAERLGAVTLIDASLRLRRGGEETRLDALDAQLDWPAVGAPATLTAAFNLRGERPRLLFWIARPGAMLRGDQSPVTARLDCDSVHIEIEGLGQSGPTPRFSGRITASAPSLRQSLRFFDISAPLPGPLENIQLVALARASARDLQLTDLRFVADDNVFDGVFTLRHEEGRALVQATLSSNFVSLKPMLADFPALLAADGQWSRDLFELPDLAGADVDLRLSAAHMRLSRLALDEASLSAILRDGRFEIALSEAQAYKGALKAKVALAAQSDSTLEIHASAQAGGLDAGALLWDAAARNDASGILDTTLSLDSQGDSIAALMRNLDGRAALLLSDGQFAGANLERALRRLDKRPLASALDIRSGRTSFDKAAATLKISHGVATLDESAAAFGPGFSLTFAGAARIGERMLSLKALASEADEAGKPRPKGTQIGFDLSGSWDDPTLAPDTRALIRRSGAAAPLLPRLDPPLSEDGEDTEK